MTKKRYFITGISTDSGKTIFSALFADALGADYWKPVQAGRPTDSDTVRTLAPNVLIHPERYVLNMPASPHLAAKIEGLSIKLSDFTCPQTSRPLVIEGAGGLLVPLNEEGDFVIDLAAKFDAEVILVANIYLGSINHSLLSIRELERRKIPCRFIVFNGDLTSATPEIILKNSSLQPFYHLPYLSELSPQTLRQQSNILKENSLNLLN